MKYHRLALALGLLLFFWLLHRIGLRAIAGSLRLIGWGFAAVLLLETVVVVFTTLGWRQTLPKPHRVPLRSLFAMRIAGDGVNAVLPAAVVGGELVRASLLSRYVPGPEALASVGLAAMAQFLAQLLFVGLGATVARAGGLEPRLRVAGLVLLGFLALFVALMSWGFRRRVSVPPPLARLLARAGRVIAGGLPGEGFGRDLAGHVFASLRERPRRLALSVLCFLGGWLVGCAEVGLVMVFLGAPVSLGTAFTIAVLAALVEGVLFFVPARVGVQEGGLYAIFLTLGLDPISGFTLGLVRRLRELTWGLAGLVLLGFFRRRERGEAALEVSAAAVEPAIGGRSAAR